MEAGELPGMGEEDRRRGAVEGGERFQVGAPDRVARVAEALARKQAAGGGGFVFDVGAEEGDAPALGR